MISSSSSRKPRVVSQVLRDLGEPPKRTGGYNIIWYNIISKHEMSNHEYNTYTSIWSRLSSGSSAAGGVEEGRDKTRRLPYCFGETDKTLACSKQPIRIMILILIHIIMCNVYVYIYIYIYIYVCMYIYIYIHIYIYIYIYIHTQNNDFHISLAQAAMAEPRSWSGALKRST